MFIIIGLLLGVILGLAVGFHVPPQYSQYMAVAILAALDSVFGGLSSYMEKNFKMDIFLTGFFTNGLLAVCLTYIGKLLDADLYLVSILVFGTRLFQNFAKIRRLLLNNFIKRDKI